jgi:amino acid transporter
MASTSVTPTNSGPNRLQRNVLSLPLVIYMSVAGMGPVFAVILNAPAAIPIVGAALPLLFLIGAIAAFFVANTAIEFSKRLPSAGSFYTFNSQSMGPAIGFLTGWLYFGGWAIFTPGVFSAIGTLTESYLATTYHITVPWQAISVVLVFIMFVLTLRGIRTTLLVDGTLLAIEVILFGIVCLIAIAAAGSGNSLTYFQPSSSASGIQGLGLGFTIAFTSFIGFEAAATLGEESRNPRRYVPLGLLASVLFVSAFFIFSNYALTAGYGVNDPEKLKQFLADPTPILTLANQYASWATPFIGIIATIAIFSGLLANENIVVRVLFSMGRDGVLPTALGKSHPRWGSPHIATYVQFAFTALFGFILAATLGAGPSGAYAFVGSIGASMIIVVYLVGCLGLIRYFARDSERSIIKHILLPIAGIAVLIYPLWAIAQPGQPAPFNLVPFIALAWLLIGVAVYMYLRAKAPNKLASVGSILADAEGSRAPAIETAEHPLPPARG